MEGAASAPVSEDDRLFQVWKGSLAVCLGILHKAGRGALAAADSGEVCGALTSLLNGATSAASEVEAKWGELRASFERSLGVVDELRALVTQQQRALGAARADAATRHAGRSASAASQTDAGATDEELRLRARCAELEDCLLAEREATRIAKVVCETLQRKAGRAEDDAADARAAANKYRSKALSLERIVEHYEAIRDRRHPADDRPDAAAKRAHAAGPVGS